MEDDLVGTTSLMEAMTSTKAPLNTSLLFELASNGTTPAGLGEAEEAFSVPDLIILSFTPGIVVFGTIGNMMCAMVLFRPKFRSMGINMYLIALAAADTTFLWVNSMTRNFIQLNFGMDYSTVSLPSCQSYVFLLYTSKCLSAWFTVVVTLERLIVVLFPHQARRFCTRKRALYAVAIVTFIVAAIYCFIPFVYHVMWREDKKVFRCEMQSYYKERQTDVILKSLDLIIYSLLPTVILSVSNTILIYKLIQSAKFRAQTTSLRRPDQDHMAWRLTITLTLVSCCFLICTVPMSSFLLHGQINTNLDHYEIYYRSFYVLELLNSAVNFLLYCASGPAFRKEMKALLIACWKQRSCAKDQSDTAGINGEGETDGKKKVSTISKSDLSIVRTPQLPTSSNWRRVNGKVSDESLNSLRTNGAIEKNQCSSIRYVTRL